MKARTRIRGGRDREEAKLLKRWLELMEAETEAKKSVKEAEEH